MDEVDIASVAVEILKFTRTLRFDGRPLTHAERMAVLRSATGSVEQTQMVEVTMMTLTQFAKR